jgi:allantoate deiminase
VIRTREYIERAQEVISRCEALARFTEDQPRICRTFLSPSMRACHQEIETWMRAVGMAVHIDAVGNLRGLYPGADGATSTRLLIGSHLDTVPDAGAYDGVLGVVLAVSLIESLEGGRLPFAIEVIGFSEEEGVRFGVPFIGSRALVATVDEDLLSRRDSQGISLREAILDYGLNPNEIPAADLRDSALGYLEFHIEQGPVLERLGLALSTVEAIAGQTRLEIIFSGTSNHAGTTPMTHRRDALVAAAEWTVRVEKEVRTIPGLVATVGVLEAKPGAANVIAGECRATLDVRHASDAVRAKGVNTLLGFAGEIAKRRSITVTSTIEFVQAATPMDPFLLSQIETAISRCGLRPHRMVSGAGHDAVILAEKVPSAMIFLRSPGGISHNPKESVLVEDVAKGLESGSHLLHQLACSTEFQKRIYRA